MFILLQASELFSLGGIGLIPLKFFTIHSNDHECRDRPIYRFADIFGRYRYIGIGKLDIGISIG
jgi:hypothetical protein